MTTFRVTAVQDVLPRIRRDETQALKKVAEEVLAEAKTRVPTKTGDLARSGRVQVNGQEATVTFDSPYAARQHEDMTFQHEGGRSAKYLELAAEQVRPDGARVIARVLGGSE